MTAAAVWRVRVGEHGWIRELVDGQPIITGNRDEAWQYPTRAEAELAIARLPAGTIPSQAVPGPPSERATYYTP